MICLKNIDKFYKLKNGKDLHALNNIDLEINRGEFVCIVGRSGSGKSSLLNIIGGLDIYDHGDLIIDNVNTKIYNQIDWNTFRNKKVGFIFQSFNLIYHLTVLENVELPLIVNGNYSIQECRKKAIEVIKKVGLKEHMYKKPGFLSGGEQQRVAIARAIVNDPEIILADEPTGQLDKKTSIEIMELIKSLGENRLVIMVTHMERFVSKYATRLLKIKDGQLIEDNTISTSLNISNENNIDKIGRKLSSLKQFNYIIINNLRRRMKSTISLFVMLGLILSLVLTAIILGHKQVQKDIFYVFSPDGPVNMIRISKNNEGFSDNEILRINNIKNVSSVTPYYETNVNIGIDERNLELTSNFGVLPDKEEAFFLKNELIHGNYAKNSNEVLMTVEGAIKLIDDINGSIFERYKLDIIKTNEIWSKVDKKTIVIKSNKNVRYVKIVGIVNYNVWNYQDVIIFGKNDLAKEIFEKNTVDELNIYIASVDFKSRDYTKQQILKVSSSCIFDQNIEVQISGIYNSIIPMNNFVKIILIITLVIISISTFALVNFNLYSRLKEVGILKSVGLSIHKIKMLYSIELLYIVSFGSIFSYFLALLLINLFVKITTQLFSTASINIESHFIYPDFLSTILVFIIGLILIYIYSYIPMKKITKYPVIDILREK